ncbi:hypothetical protein EYF80_061525 [Liparis tanakae]|uniref:Uncharacterized protein n=1 Tax=Liparis tanakae TaxID=230148 RepID=A0A4Z2EHC8_9TELE|nr:hypothetical protein EYF80_061525 [Liparis tanakae]
MRWTSSGSPQTTKVIEVPFDDDEGEEDHWDSEDDSGYGSMSEWEDEEEEDDQPFHPLTSPSLVRRPPSSTGQKRTKRTPPPPRPASNPPRRGRRGPCSLPKILADG